MKTLSAKEMFEQLRESRNKVHEPKDEDMIYEESIEPKLEPDVMPSGQAERFGE